MLVFYYLLIPALVSATTFKSGVPKMTPEQEQKARADILKLINSKVDDRGIKTLIPAFVRLIFHDCAGGCDGCIAQERAENRGLTEIVELIDTVYNGDCSYCKMMSRSDFWALCAIVAVEEAVRLNNEKNCVFFRSPPWCEVPKVDIHFQYGRKDCHSSPFYEAGDVDIPDMPDALGDLEHILGYFDRMYYFGAFESTAATTAHTLGRANPLTSPYNGSWEAVYNEDGLNRVFLLNMLNEGHNWIQEQNEDPIVPDPLGRDVYQWNAYTEFTGTYMMLNSDICLIKNIDIADLSVSGKSQCTYNTCPPSPTAIYTYPLAIDINVFAGSFSYVMQRIIENGYVLRDPTASTEEANAQMSQKARTLFEAIEKRLEKLLRVPLKQKLENLKNLSEEIKADVLAVLG